MLVRFTASCCSCGAAPLLACLLLINLALAASDDDVQPEISPREVFRYLDGEWTGTGETIGGSTWPFTSSINEELNFNSCLERAHIGGPDSHAGLIALTNWHPHESVFRNCGTSSWGERWVTASRVQKCGDLFWLCGTTEGSTNDGNRITEQRLLQAVDVDNFIVYYWDRKQGDFTPNDQILVYRRQGSSGEVNAASIVRERLNEILEKNPQDDGALRGRGLLLAAIGEYESAAADLKRVTELRPNDHWVSYVLSPILRRADMGAYVAHCREMRKRCDETSGVMVQGRACRRVFCMPIVSTIGPN